MSMFAQAAGVSLWEEGCEHVTPERVLNPGSGGLTLCGACAEKINAERRAYVANARQWMRDHTEIHT